MKSASSLVEIGPCFTLWYRTSKPWFFSPCRGWGRRLSKGLEETSQLLSNGGMARGANQQKPNPLAAGIASGLSQSACGLSPWLQGLVRGPYVGPIREKPGGFVPWLRERCSLPRVVSVPLFLCLSMFLCVFLPLFLSQSISYPAFLSAPLHK